MTAQVVINGVLAGITWGLVGYGFSIIYSTARILHVAYAATFLVGSYVGLSLSHLPGVPLVFCFCGAVVAAMILGLLIEFLFYHPLRVSGSSNLILFLVSLGIVIVVENGIALIYGSDIQLPRGRGIPSVLHLFGAQISTIRLGSAITAIALFVTSWSFIRLTRIGKQMRAVASDSELAAAVGIDGAKTIVIAMLIGSALSGAAGFLIAFDTAATPTMGFTVFLIGVTAAIIGGIDYPPGAMLGGLFIGIVQHIGGWFFSAEWQEALVFIVLIAFLLIRPQGIFGKRLRKVTV